MSFTMSGAGEVKWDFNRFDKYEEKLDEASCGSTGYQKGGEVKCDKCGGKGCEHCDKKGTHKKSEKKAKSGGSRPDYLDFDKDGDKEEPMTDALGEGVLDAALEGDKKLGELQKKADKDGKRAAKGLKFKEEATDGEEGYKPVSDEANAGAEKAKAKAYNLDQAAQRKGDSKEADKQFKRRMAMDFKTKMRKEHLELFSSTEIEALGLSAE